jgi:hypothetical protein
MTRRPNGTKWDRMRSLRVPDDVWQAAKDAAERRGEPLSVAVVRFLRRYGKS